MRDMEYDSFGPWVYEIDNEHTMPPQFEKHYKIEEKPHMLFKIPVKEERRNLRPGMIMYTSVVGLYESYVYIMELDNGRVTSNIVDYSDITAVMNSIHLLHGIFTLYTDKRIYEIHYNSSSENIINKAVKIVRDNMKGNSSSAEIINTTDQEKINTVDTSFFNKINDLFGSILLEMNIVEKTIDPVMYQKRMRIKPKKENIISILIDLFLQTELLSSMFLGLCNELVLVTTGNNINHRRHPVHKKSVYYIPYENISSLDITESEKYRDILQVSVCIGKNTINTYIEKDNTDVNALLEYGTAQGKLTTPHI